MHRFLTFALICIGTVWVTACRELPTQPDLTVEPVEETVTRGAPFVLGVGSLALFGPDSLGLRFVGVISDDRCPADAECVQAGEARVMMHLEQGDVVRDQIVMRLPGLVPTPFADNELLASTGYTFQLLRLLPYPEADETIDRAAYRAMVVVR